MKVLTFGFNVDFINSFFYPINLRIKSNITHFIAGHYSQKLSSFIDDGNSSCLSLTTGFKRSNSKVDYEYSAKFATTGIPDANFNKQRYILESINERQRKSTNTGILNLLKQTSLSLCG